METTVSRPNTFLLNIKKDFVENRKSILLGVGALWVIYLLAGVLMGYNIDGGGIGEIILLGIISLVLGCIGASFIFSDMKTKQGRISAIMTPATQFEKFLTRWLAAVPMLLILLSIGCVLTEAARICTCWLTVDSESIPKGYMHFIDVENLLDVIFMKKGAFIFPIASFLFNQAFFLFGAILWPKLSFVKTLVALWVFQMVLSILSVSVFRYISPDLVAWLDSDSFIFAFNTVLLLITAVLYALTYWRYRRSQVTYRLF